MEKQPIFYDNMAIRGEDFNRIGQGADDALVHVINDFISSDNHYTGLTATIQNSLTIRVAPGRCMRGGLVYARETESLLSVAQYVTASGKAKLCIVGLLSTVNGTPEQRSFLISPDSDATEVRSLPFERRRIVEVSIIPGAPGGDPQPPAVPADQVLLAVATMNTVGLESVVQYLGALAPRLGDHEVRVDALENWRAATDPVVGGIRSDLAGLTKKTETLATRDQVAELGLGLGRLTNLLRQPSSFSSFDADEFVDASKTDPGQSPSAFRVNRGLLFGYAGITIANLDLLNPADPSIIKSDGNLILPKFVSVPRLSSGSPEQGYAGDISISQYQQQTQVLRSVVAPPTETHYGLNVNLFSEWYRQAFPSFFANSQNGNYVDYTGMPDITITGASVTASPSVTYQLDTVTTSITGALLAQTVLVPNVMWLTGVNLYFTQVGATGDVNVLVTEVEASGKPNLQAIVASTVVSQVDLKKFPIKTTVALPKVKLDGGRRYAIVLITPGDHRVAIVSGSNYTQGDLFAGTNSGYLQGDPLKDLMFDLLGAQFLQTRTELALKSISLAGGISDLEIVAPQVVPKGTTLRYEIQPEGSQAWYGLEDPTFRLSGLPQIVNLRAVLLGTSELAPGFYLTFNGITATRTATTLSHLSSLRTLPGAASQFTVQVIVDRYVAGAHTVGALLGANGNSYTAALSTVGVEPNGSRRFTFVFNIPGGLSSYKIAILGTRTSGSAPFVVLRRADYAQ